jgi:uncharacterized membrane protein YhaH (DUF805 family)
MIVSNKYIFACISTLFWIAFITLAAFPELVENFNKLLIQFDFNTAKVILLVVLVYLLDAFITIMIVPLHDADKIYILELFVCVILHLIVFYIAFVFIVSAIWVILFMSLTMGLIKFISVFQAIKKTSRNDDFKLMSI